MSNDLKFIGIDLSWKINPSKKNTTAVCLINNYCNLIKYKYIITDDELINFIKEYKSNNELIIAIDAPLIVNNKNSMRECDRMLLKEGIPCLPINKTIFDKLYGGIRGKILVGKLKRLGFELLTNIFEVYPYATLKNLFFKNTSVPKYKKNKEEFDKLVNALKNKFHSLLITHYPLPITHHLIDAIICAYTIYVYFNNKTSCKILGNKKEGFILIPKFYYDR